MKYDDESFKRCRMIVYNINKKHLIKYNTQITRTILQSYYEKGWNKGIHRDFVPRISNILLEVTPVYCGMK